MSLQTWLATYYQTPAREVPEAEALQHSLLKWRGLQPSLLKRHGLLKINGFIRARPGEIGFIIDSSTCALCVHYHDDRKVLSNDHQCAGCPIYEMRQMPCDATTSEEIANGINLSPYHTWVLNSDPKPMIQVLRQAIKYVQQHAKSR